MHGADQLATGLWFDVDLHFPKEPVEPWVCHCNSPDSYPWLPGQSCAETCAQLSDESSGLCGNGLVKVWLRIQCMKLKLGFIPVRSADCDPTRASDPDVSFDDDRRIGWMKNFPGGTAYRQSCLEVVRVLVWGHRRGRFVHVVPPDDFDKYRPGISARVEVSCVWGTTNNMHLDEVEGKLNTAIEAHPVDVNDSSGMDPNDFSRLVNHYEPAAPVAPIASRWFKRLPVLTLPPFFARICTDCTGNVDVPSVECPTCGPFGKIQGITRPNEVQLLYVLPDQFGGGAGVLRSDGELQIVTDQLGPALRATFASDAVMLNAVEPSTSIGGGARNPAAVALSADGTTIVDRVYQQQAGFVGQYDREVLVDEVEGGVRAMSLDGSVLGGPSPRRGFQGVYSRASGRVFVVGGTDAASSATSGDIWWRRATGSDWYRVPLDGYAPEDVIAATYSYRDHNLWVLDQHRHGGLLLARLVSIDPSTGHHTLVGAWPRVRLLGDWVYDRRWLVVDRDGSLLVVASSSRLRNHAIVRIDLADTPTVDGVRLAPGLLGAAPAVDAGGYSLVIERRNKLPKLKRLERLITRPGRWQDLGGCL